MKNFLLTISTIAVALTSCGTPDAPKRNFVHATYEVASSFKSKEVIEKSNYGQFDFIYLMSEPEWVAEDFDLPIDTILKKYVTDFQYPQGDSGKALTEFMIGVAQKQGAKILLSFSGVTFDVIAKDDTRRANYAKMMAQFAKKYNYDGLELDWEHTVTIPTHNAFMKDIRAELDIVEKDLGKKMYLTTALNTKHKCTKAEADEASIYSDWINVMCYDFGGGIWDSIPTHNTPAKKIRDIMVQWDVFDPKKISFGVASYGFYYNGIKPGQQVEAGKTLKDYGRYFNYNELQALLDKGWTSQYDSIEEVNYFFSPDSTEFVTIETVIEKVKWAAYDKGYQGIFWWVWRADFVPAKEGEKFGQHLVMDPVHEIIVDFRNGK